MAAFIPRYLRQLRDTLISNPQDGESILWSDADGEWVNAVAPVGDHDHAGEDIASGTVADARIAATIARDSEVSAAITLHSNDPTDVHGISDTAALAYLIDLDSRQPVDSDLTAIAALSTTAFGRALLTLADAAALLSAAGAAAAAHAHAGEDITSGIVAEARIAATIARDAEVTAAVSAEATARDVAIAAAIAALLDTAPGALDTLNELAAALGDDPSFATTITTALAGKQPLDSDLTAIAALATTAFGRSFLALADAAAGRALIDLEPGTDIPSLAVFNDHSARHEEGGADELAITVGQMDAEGSDAGQLPTSDGAGGVAWEDPSASSGGSGEALERAVAQVGHGLAVGDVVRLSGTSYIKAQANSAANAEVAGIIAAVADADNFTLHYGGRITGLSALSAETVYFLDDDIAGLLTATPPSDPGDVSKPVLVADSTTSGYFFNFRGIVNVAAALPDPDPYVHLRDEKAANTDGGTFTSGAWQTRELNTEVADTDNLAALAANQITLEAGTYDVLATCPAYNVGRHKARLQNVTDATTLVIGTSVYVNNADAGGLAAVRGRFTIAVQRVIELQHRCQVTSASLGFGVASNFGVSEVYADIELRRVS